MVKWVQICSIEYTYGQLSTNIDNRVQIGIIKYDIIFANRPREYTDGKLSTNMDNRVQIWSIGTQMVSRVHIGQ